MNRYTDRGKNNRALKIIRNRIRKLNIKHGVQNVFIMLATQHREYLGNTVKSFEYKKAWELASVGDGKINNSESII